MARKKGGRHQQQMQAPPGSSTVSPPENPDLKYQRVLNGLIDGFKVARHVSEATPLLSPLKATCEPRILFLEMIKARLITDRLIWLANYVPYQAVNENTAGLRDLKGKLYSHIQSLRDIQKRFIGDSAEQRPDSWKDFTLAFSNHIV